MTKGNPMKKLTLSLILSLTALNLLPKPGFTAEAVPGKAITSSDLKVAIDAGHGGNDHGVEDAQDQEKTLNLHLAQQLKTALEKHNIKVIMLRDQDEELELKERAAKAVSAGANYLISLHMDTPTTVLPASYELYYHHASALPLVSAVDQSLRQSLSITQKAETQKQRNLYMIAKVPFPAILVEADWKTFSQQPQKQAQLIQGLTAGVLSLIK
jgi:N-acetylmuramoyl-L-alanine amidase